MREILSIVVVATLLVAAVVDVVAAGARTGVSKNHFCYVTSQRGGHCRALHHEELSDRTAAAIRHDAHFGGRSKLPSGVSVLRQASSVMERPPS